MPRFCKVLKNVFTFSLSRLNVFVTDEWFFTDLSLHFGGMFPLTTLTHLLFVLSAWNSLNNFNTTFGPKIFLTSYKDIKYKHSRDLFVTGLKLRFHDRFN